MATAIRNGMTASEKYLFDLQGFLVVRGVLSPEELSAANAAVDHSNASLKERKGELRNSNGTAQQFSGDGSTGRRESGSILQWPKPHADVFRSVLDHPKLVPYFTELCGRGYRMDHLPLFIAQTRGCEGFSLHGGCIKQNGDPVMELKYQCNQGSIYNPLLACSVQLSDHPAGGGGFVVIPGSHKANFPTPTELVNGSDELADGVLHQPVTKAGDVVLFSEGTVHGARSWTAAHERRIAIFRFAPATCSYGRAYLQWPEGLTEGMTPSQQAVVQPPFATRLDRSCIEPSGEVTIDQRAANKRKWDEVVFENKYF